MIQVFKNQSFGEVRVAEVNGEPMFCLADVCNVLGLRQGDVRQRLSEGVVSTQPLETAGGIQQANFVNEDGLYDTILDSRKPEAKQFRKWVTSEVLPSIRKHGAYMTEQTIEKMLNDPDFAISLLTKLKEEKTARIEAERKNAILMHVNKTYTMTEIAKELNMKSATILNRILSDAKIQYQSNGTWVMYSKYSDLGYETIKQEVLDNGKVVYHRRITQLGRDFILRLLQKQI